MNAISSFLQSLGRAQFFLFSLLLAVPQTLLRPRLLAQQIYSVGVLSLVIIVLSGSFVGMVLALQFYHTLQLFGSPESLGVAVALAVVREFGPVVTALLSGMEMMAVDPMRRVIAPRFLAGLISMPLLVFIFSMMAIGVAGGHAIGVTLLGVDAGSYWAGIHQSLEFEDIREAMIKSLVFGLACSWIAVYQGYHAEPTSGGVARATTNTVVISSLSVLALDFVLTALML